MSKFIDADRLRAEIETRRVQHQQDYESGDTTEFHRIVEDDAIVGVIDSLQQDPRFPQYDNIVDKVFGAGNLESWEYEEAEMLVALAKEELLKSLQLEQPDPKELPTLRQAIEEYMYDQLVRKIPEFKAGRLELKLSLQESTVKKLKKDYEQNGIPATAVGKVFTNTDPMNMYVERDQWAALLGQFDNGQRVRIILVKEDAE